MQQLRMGDDDNNPQSSLDQPAASGTERDDLDRVATHVAAHKTFFQITSHGASQSIPRSAR